MQTRTALACNGGANALINTFLSSLYAYHTLFVPLQKMFFSVDFLTKNPSISFNSNVVLHSN